MYKCFSCGSTFDSPQYARYNTDANEELPFESDGYDACPYCRGEDIAPVHECSVCRDYFPEENDGVFIPAWNEYICEDCYRKV